MSSTPQRQREHGSPMRQGGGYPPAMFGGHPGHHPYPGGPPMQMKAEFESSPTRYHGGPLGPPSSSQGGGPHSHHSQHYGGPQAGPGPGYHLSHPPGPGQFAQYPYYGGYGGPSPSNGYFPPHHPSELGPRGPGGVGPGGFGPGPPFGHSNPDRKSQHVQHSTSHHSSPSEKSTTQHHKDLSPSNSNNNNSPSKGETSLRDSTASSSAGVILESRSNISHTSKSPSISPQKSVNSPHHSNNKKLNSDEKPTTSANNTNYRSNSNINTSTPHDVDDDELASNVNPMRSDFHFFASDHKAETLTQIEKLNTEQKSSGDDNDEKDKDKNSKEPSPFVKMTDLNERLMKLWEGASSRVRTVYMQKEESDRYRFMSEDEIASRHCATLTSRTLVRKNNHLSGSSSIVGSMNATPTAVSTSTVNNNVTVPSSTGNNSGSGGGSSTSNNKNNTPTTGSNAVLNVVTKDEDDTQDKSGGAGSKRQQSSSENATDGTTTQVTSEYESPTKKSKETVTKEKESNIEETTQTKREPKEKDDPPEKKGEEQEVNVAKVEEKVTDLDLKDSSNIKKDEDTTMTDDTKEKEMLEKSQQEDYHFHAWVYVDMVESSGFFIEATSG